MKLSNIKSNPYYHFVDVDDTSTEIAEMQNWCTTTIGLTHSHLWGMEQIRTGGGVSTRATPFGPKTTYTFIYRFNFAKIEHRDWFILRWS